MSFCTEGLAHVSKMWEKQSRHVTHITHRSSLDGSAIPSLTWYVILVCDFDAHYYYPIASIATIPVLTSVQLCSNLRPSAWALKRFGTQIFSSSQHASLPPSSIWISSQLADSYRCLSSLRASPFGVCIGRNVRSSTTASQACSQLVHLLCDSAQ